MAPYRSNHKCWRFVAEISRPLFFRRDNCQANLGSIILRVAHIRAPTLRINSRYRFWRQLTGWIAVYALILQGIFAGLAGMPVTGAAASSEICHSGAAAGLPSGAPADDGGAFHCLLCATAGDDVARLARVSAPVTAIVSSLVLWPPSLQSLVSPFRHSDHWSRAPPVAA